MAFGTRAASRGRAGSGSRSASPASRRSAPPGPAAAAPRMGAAGSMGPPPPPAQRPEETRFLRLLEELRVRLGGNFRRSEEAGFSRPAAVTALRAMVGNSTQSDVNRGTGFRGQWPEAIRFRVAAVLRDVAARTPTNRELVLQVLSPRALASVQWLSDVQAVVVDDGHQEQPDVEELPVFGPERPASRPANIDGFFAAAQFAGRRQGFIYKMGDAGLGYYRDTAPAAASSPSSAAEALLYSGSQGVASSEAERFLAAQEQAVLRPLAGLQPSPALGGARLGGPQQQIHQQQQLGGLPMQPAGPPVDTARATEEIRRLSDAATQLRLQIPCNTAQLAAVEQRLQQAVAQRDSQQRSAAQPQPSAIAGSQPVYLDPSFLVNTGAGLPPALTQLQSSGAPGASTLVRPRAPIPSHRAALIRHFRSDALNTMGDLETENDTMVLNRDGSFVSKSSKLKQVEDLTGYF